MQKKDAKKAPKKRIRKKGAPNPNHLEDFESLLKKAAGSPKPPRT